MYDTLTLNDVAKDLRKSKRSILRLAQSGSLPVITIPRKTGFTYVVPLQSYFAWKNQKSVSNAQNKLLSDLTYLKSLEADWIDWCKKGLLTGKPLSEVTIRDYTYHLNYYWARLPRRYAKTPLISFELVREVLGNIDPKSYSQKMNTLNAVRTFVKYLIVKNLIDKNVLAKLREIKPKRVFPPRRLHCTLEQFNLLLAEASKERSNNDVILNTALVSVLGFAGLRATELCNLRVQDVDLVNRTLFVYLGKGKKNRTVGICKKLQESLTNYLQIRPSVSYENFFVAKSSSNGEYVPFTRDVLWHKIKRLSERAGVNVNVHGLRRTFATIAANAGKPINIISLALGHADLKTTQGYLMTTQDEVIREMQRW